MTARRIPIQTPGSVPQGQSGPAGGGGCPTPASLPAPLSRDVEAWLAVNGRELEHREHIARKAYQEAQDMPRTDATWGYPPRRLSRWQRIKRDWREGHDTALIGPFLAIIFGMSFAAIIAGFVL